MKQLDLKPEPGTFLINCKLAYGSSEVEYSSLNSPWLHIRYMERAFDCELQSLGVLILDFFLYERYWIGYYFRYRDMGPSTFLINYFLQQQVHLVPTYKLRGE